MKTTKTQFSPKLVIKLISDLASMVPGIKRVQIEEANINFDENLIYFDAWLSDEMINVKSTVFELQKLVYYNLTKKFYVKDLVVNISIHI